jgi:hypothetical protein
MSNDAHYKKLIKTVSGSIICAAKAHPGIIDTTMANSVAKRIVGQLLNNFKITEK